MLGTTLLAIAGLAVPAPGGLRAETLPKEACDILGEERARLLQAGVKDLMAAGATQARAKLAPAQMEQIRRFIEVDEQLIFRCGLFRTRNALPRDVDDPAEAEPKAKKGEIAKKSRPKAQPAAGAAEAGEAAKPAPRRKAKSDDAYRPPAGAASSD